MKILVIPLSVKHHSQKEKEKKKKKSEKDKMKDKTFFPFTYLFHLVCK